MCLPPVLWRLLSKYLRDSSSSDTLASSSDQRLLFVSSKFCTVDFEFVILQYTYMFQWITFFYIVLCYFLFNLLSFCVVFDFCVSSTPTSACPTDDVFSTLVVHRTSYPLLHSFLILTVWLMHTLVRIFELTRKRR